jgi:formylglycine-generating enzyme
MIVCESPDPIACHSGMCETEPGAGGATAGGGTSSAGGSTADAGATAAAGAVANGGATAAAGTSGRAGAAGVGCNGGFEAVETISGHDLCVAKMVTILGETSDTNTDYQIDATEVTKGQYRSWLMTDPTVPTSLDVRCGWKAAWSSPEPGTATDWDAEHHPIASVDWCDAYGYCAGVGKRLCGRVGGGSNDASDAANAVGIDQWYTACSSDGAFDERGYPYGQTYSPTACNGLDAAKGGAVMVATMTSCQSPIARCTGIFDLSGNVAEWEDSCDGHLGMLDGCRIRGGSFDNLGDLDTASAWEWLSCGAGVATNRFVSSDDIGFRCCSM